MGALMGERQQESGWVCLAVVAGAHGIRGALKLRCFTERPEDVVAYGPLFDDAGQPLPRLRVQRILPGGVIAEIAGLADRTAAERWRGKSFHVPRTSLPEPAADEFYYDDLQGLTALDVDGTPLGVIRRVDNYGAGDVIEIASDDGKVLTLPFDQRTVPEINLAAGHVIVAPPQEVGA